MNRDLKLGHDVALRGLVAVTQIAFIEGYTHRFVGIRQALSTAVFLLERNDSSGIEYLDVAVSSMVNRFGVDLTVKLLGIDRLVPQGSRV